jgi:hypothetical protein
VRERERPRVRCQRNGLRTTSLGSHSRRRATAGSWLPRKTEPGRNWFATTLCHSHSAFDSQLTHRKVAHILRQNFQRGCNHVSCYESMVRTEMHDRRIFNTRPFRHQHRERPNAPTKATTARPRSRPDRSDATRTGGGRTAAAHLDGELHQCLRWV